MEIEREVVIGKEKVRERQKRGLIKLQILVEMEEQITKDGIERLLKKAQTFSKAYNYFVK